MKIRDERLSEIFWVLSGINTDAYRDVYLVSNPVLNKSPITSRFIHYCLTGIPQAADGTISLFRQ